MTPAAPPPVTGVHLGIATHCARSIRATYAGELQAGSPLRLVIKRDGPYALVSWVTRDMGGMSILHRRGTTWCRVANGGGALDEATIAATDDIGAIRARRLLSNAGWTKGTARAR